MEQRWNDTDGGKPKDSENNLFQCHLFHRESHMGGNPGQPGEKLATNRLSYGTAMVINLKIASCAGVLSVKCAVAAGFRMDINIDVLFEANAPTVCCVGCGKRRSCKCDRYHILF
jgi:hypothetical protein